jgi:hypothetical protein
MGTRKGYVCLYDTFEEKVFLVFDYGRLDITGLLDIQGIKKDLKSGTGEIEAFIPVMLISEDQ